jgi:hypothetical protein
MPAVQATISVPNRHLSRGPVIWSAAACRRFCWFKRSGAFSRRERLAVPGATRVSCVMQAGDTHRASVPQIFAPLGIPHLLSGGSPSAETMRVIQNSRHRLRISNFARAYPIFNFVQTENPQLDFLVRLRMCVAQFQPLRQKDDHVLADKSRSGE